MTKLEELMERSAKLRNANGRMKDDDKAEKMAVALIWCVSLPFILANIVISPIVRGWVLVKLWAWFAVPTFGLPTIHIASAIGISLIAGYLTADQRRLKTESSGKPLVDTWTAIALSILTPMLCLLFGWVVHHWM
jgi:hypothetical protein